MNYGIASSPDEMFRVLGPRAYGIPKLLIVQYRSRHNLRHLILTKPLHACTSYWILRKGFACSKDTEFWNVNAKYSVVVQEHHFISALTAPMKSSLLGTISRFNISTDLVWNGSNVIWLCHMTEVENSNCNVNRTFRSIRILEDAWVVFAFTLTANNHLCVDSLHTSVCRWDACLTKAVEELECDDADQWRPAGTRGCGSQGQDPAP